MDSLKIITMLLVSFCGRHAASYAHDVVRAVEKYRDVDPRVLASMMRQESHCDRRVTGKLGELGQMQLKRNTWATSGYNHLSDKQLRRPSLNILLGARHLHRCLLKCNGDLPGALGMYSGLSKDKKTGRCRASSYSWAILARIGES